MIRHIVMYKLIDGSDVGKNMLRDKFMSMQGKIKELREITVGIDVLMSARSYDVVLDCLFDSLADMDAYKADPMHLPVMHYVRSVVSESHSVDYII